MSLSLDDIKYFITVSETENVTRASEILGISQPALSYAIKRLERELGGDLLIRLKSGTKLTKLGEEFLKRSRKLIFNWEQAQNLANSEFGHIEASYTFAIHPSVALYSLKEFLPSITKEYPDLDINFMHGLSREMTEKVISWEADFGIVVNPVKHPDLVIIKLCTDDVTIFHRAKSLKRLIFDENLLQSQTIIKKLKKSFSFDRQIKSANLEVIANLTSEGMGYGVLPTRVAKLHKGLIPLKGAPIFKDEICLIYRPEKHKSVVSKKLIELIRKSKI